MSIHSIQDSNALLLYKVGPIFVCSPTLPVESVIMPPKFTAPPGSNNAEPGMFKSIHGMVRIIDLRVRFGVDKDDYRVPGRIVIAEVEGGRAGFWVDEIEDVISFPEAGWKSVPTHIPREVFSRTLVKDNKIRLYADFDGLDKFKSTGYLRKHIEQLMAAENKSADTGRASKTRKRVISLTEKKVQSDENININISQDSNKGSDEEKKTDSIKIETQPEHVLSDTLSRKIEKREPAVYKTIKTTYLTDFSVVNKNRIEKKPETITKSIDKSVAKKIQPVESSVNTHDFVRVITEDKSDKDDVFRQSSKKSSLLLSALVIVVLMFIVYLWLQPFDVSVPEKEKSDMGRIFSEDQDRKIPEIKIAAKYELDGKYTPGKEEVISVETQGKAEQSEQIETTNLKNNNRKNIEVNELGEQAFPVSDNEPGRVKLIKNNTGVTIVINEFDEPDSSVYSDKTTESLENELLEKLDIIGKVSKIDQAVAENTVADDNDLPVKLSSVDSKNSIAEEELTDLKNNNGRANKEGVNNENLKADIMMESSEVEKIIINSKKHISDDFKIKTRKYIHIVIKGDTLWHIAKRYVKNPWRYPELARLSKIKNPDLIYPGNKIIIIVNSRQYDNK